MTASVVPFEARFGTTSGPAVRLRSGSARAEILPFLGFNCLHWDVAGESILFAEPTETPNPSPTRSGHPILFPFPNRIRNGSFSFDGRKYHLPLNDSTRTHAIHGFTPRNPWRQIAVGSEFDRSFVTGEFHLSRDLPESRPFWPSDFILRVTYRLSPDALAVSAEVTNPDSRPLPFGLGYHPYFRPPGIGSGPIDLAVLRIESSRLWESIDGLPSGCVIRAPVELRFDTPRPIGPTGLDHVFTCPPPGPGMRAVAVLGNSGSKSRLVIRADESFRELVLFTPVHRNAIAIEPYTCSTDAVNIQTGRLSAGWREIPPGGVWSATVEYRLEPSD